MRELGPGALVGTYEIESFLGGGGMSDVYRARDTRLGREVALKVLASALGDDMSFRERFEREARAIAATDHPNVIPIYDAGVQDGVLFLAMRYVDGSDLHALVVGQGPLPPDEAARITAAVAAALDSVHARGLVHRDVKASNVLIQKDDGHVYLADFGIARPTESPALTRTGVFVGTVDYVPPEQIQGGAVDARSDIYSLGAVLYFALTGRAPYARESEVGVIYAHLTEPPPRPSESRPGLALAFDEVVARAMAKAPDDRYATAGELGRAAVAAAAAPAPVAPAKPMPAPAPASAAPPPAKVPETYPPCPPPPSPTEPRNATVPPREIGVPARAPETVLVPGVTIPPAAVPAAPPADNGLVTFRLRDGFRYVHEPLAGDQALPFIGNHDVVRALRERIDHSAGGSFLITGFRGVGKTTVIKRALEELTAAANGHGHVIPISLNVARPITTDELLFEVVRRLFESLSDFGIFDRLDPEIQRALIVAYTRTSLSFKETRGQAHERSRSLDVGLPGIAAPGLGRMTPKLAFSKRETRSLATEAAFLAYSDADVEHDFLRIVSLVRRSEPIVTTPKRRLRPFRAQKRRRPWMGQLIVVIDELDKLTETEDGLACVEQILTALKNLLTTHGVHFLFVAGTDLHDRALHESHRGNSVYESVFGWQVYVPCMWDAPRRLLEELVHPDEQRSERFEALVDYLTFKARGVPRLLLIELNSLVIWRDRQALLAFDGLGVTRVEFYASLQRVLAEFLEAERTTGAFTIPIDEDRWRLGAYYVTDWILRSKGSSFTVEDILDSERAHAVDPTLVISAGKVEALVEHLVRHGIIEQVRGLADQAVVADVPDVNKAAYRVVEDIEHSLARFQRGSERERADLGGGDESGRGGGQPWADSMTFGRVAGGRYELLREIDRGGTASVYHARDRVLGRDVAVKVLENPVFTGDPTVRARFQRQRMIAASLDHPNIVRTYDTFEEEDGRIGIVMQLLDGISLRDLLDWAQIVPEEAVRLALELLEALAYLGERGIARLDLKPSNVILDVDRRPVIIDLGLAKGVEEDDPRREVTRLGVLVGTPAYAAPEQLDGRRVDIRTDLYTLGLLLYEMLAGRPARRGQEIAAVIDQARRDDVDLSALRVSPALRDVLARAVSRLPEERFQTPAEMREALLLAPEAVAVTVP